MSEDTDRARACLNEIDPRNLSYDEWMRVGMALKDAGCSASDFDDWSRRDPDRYHNGECTEKWNSFRGNGSGRVTIASLVDLVKQQGGTVPTSTAWNDDGDGALDWGDSLYIAPKKKPLSFDDVPSVVDANWLATEEIPPPASDWAPGDLSRYLEAMFESEELVGIVTVTWFNDRLGKWLPQKGMYKRTAGELLEELGNCKGDIGKVIGDTKDEVGAWIRINPLDGNGVRDENVTAFRHALLEADDEDLGKQLAVIRELDLPCSAIVHSGNKSIHALVKVDAADRDEYRKRVDYLYKIVEKNGLKVDPANRNPSRLSRLPGVARAGKPQYMISGPCGKRSWTDWVDWVEDLKDDLPNPEPLSGVWDNLPPLADELIAGILRTGHKLLLTGPSKAGKSFALIQLCIAVAEGREWMGLPCKRGPVLYLNLELDARSCWHRFKDVYTELGWKPDNLANIDVWNLRGHSVPLDRLVPKLLRRAHRKGYIAVIIDPIYKVQTGDENSAEDMATFCNQFDKIAAALSAAVIYCHHHSKGSQGQKRAIDRAAGSGVFGRDPDAVLDFIELEIDANRRKEVVSKAVCVAIEQAIRDIGQVPGQVDELDRAEPARFLKAAQARWSRHSADLSKAAFAGREKAEHMSGWRIEGTLREFATPKPIRIWFDYPTHKADHWNLLADAKATGEEPPWKAQQNAKDQAAKEKAQTMRLETEAAIEACGGAGQATVKAVSEELGMSVQATRTRIDKYTKMKRHDGLIINGGKS
jgi:RecA-family ATPase